MSRTREVAIVAGVAAALAVAGAGAAIAATDALSSAGRHQAVIDDAAKQLGVEPAELSDALKQALGNRIDDDVAAGRLTEAQGETLKERIESAVAPVVLGGFRGPAGDRFGMGHAGQIGGLDAATSYLGVTEAELRDALADGKSLADIAKSEGKAVDGLVEALVAEAEARIDSAVDDGRLTEAQAERLEEGLDDRITRLVNREPAARGFRAHRLERGFGRFHDERPAFRGPHA
jgi:hypothetical protein